MTHTLVLRLAGPTQGWDRRVRVVSDPTVEYRGRFGAEYLIPTRSGIRGMLACALGIPRGGDYGDLDDLRYLLRIDQPGRARREFRTTRRRDGKGRLVTQMLGESVLDDAVFLAGVGGGVETLERLDVAVRRPRWPLYLGRREFPPAGPVTLGVHEGAPEAVLAGFPWQAAAHWQSGRSGEGLRVVELPVWKAASRGLSVDWFEGVFSW